MGWISGVYKVMVNYKNSIGVIRNSPAVGCRSDSCAPEQWLTAANDELIVFYVTDSRSAKHRLRRHRTAAMSTRPSELSAIRQTPHHFPVFFQRHAGSAKAMDPATAQIALESMLPRRHSLVAHSA